MSPSRRVAVAVAAAAIVYAVPPVGAEESGTFTSLASMTTEYTTIAHADGTIIGGAAHGTSTTLESSGAPFVEGTHSETTCVVYGKHSPAGTDIEAACTTTSPTGDELYATSKRRAGDIAEGGGGAGDLVLVGGTGAMSGVTGSCTYDIDYLAKARYVSRLECAWRR